MLTSNRSDFRPYPRRASVTISNRRVRTRTHGGVAGVGGQPPPLCRSNGVLGKFGTRPKIDEGSLFLASLQFKRPGGSRGTPGLFKLKKCSFSSIYTAP